MNLHALLAKPAVWVIGAGAGAALLAARTRRAGSTPAPGPIGYLVPAPTVNDATKVTLSALAPHITDVITHLETPLDGRRFGALPPRTQVNPAPASAAYKRGTNPRTDPSTGRVIFY